MSEAEQLLHLYNFTGGLTPKRCASCKPNTDGIVVACYRCEHANHKSAFWLNYRNGDFKGCESCATHWNDTIVPDFCDCYDIFQDPPQDQSFRRGIERRLSDVSSIASDALAARHAVRVISNNNMNPNACAFLNCIEEFVREPIDS
jgi:hypothetical protein